VSSLSLFRTAVRPGSSTVGLSGIMTALIALMPKCPICWMALMSAFALAGLLVPLVASIGVPFSRVPVGLLTLSARRARRYGPFCGMVAIVMYLCKFHFNYNRVAVRNSHVRRALWSVRLIVQQAILNVSTRRSFVTNRWRKSVKFILWN
jgi:hypothetical protein